MAQHIGCHIEDFEANLLKSSELNFASINLYLWEVDKVKEKFVWLHTIDEYGDSIFNYLQIPYLVEELQNLAKQAAVELQKTILDFVNFISTVNDENRNFVRFIGD
jgi:hypothetical protein